MEEVAAGVAPPCTEPILCADRIKVCSTRDARSEVEGVMVAVAVTGAVAACATTAAPEEVGGVRRRRWCGRSRSSNCSSFFR